MPRSLFGVIADGGVVRLLCKKKPGLWPGFSDDCRARVSHTHLCEPRGVAFSSPCSATDSVGGKSGTWCVDYRP